MASCLIALGSNLGDRSAAIQGALEQLQRHPDVQLLRPSGLHRTRPIGGAAGQPSYLNAAALVETALAPQQLFKVLQALEQHAGRTRQQRWSARRLDLDLLLYEQQVIETAQLVLPHPRMTFRRFVLEPAAEVAPEMIHPLSGLAIADLLAHLDTTPDYVALAGLDQAAKQQLASQLASRIAARLLSASTHTAPGEPLRPPDVAGPQAAQALEWLQRCCGWLADIPLVENRMGQRLITVSDYWFDELLLWVGSHRAEYEPRTVEQFEQILSRASSEVATPKLLVVVHSHQGSSSGGGREAPRAISLPSQQGLDDAWQHAIGRYRGPILRLDAAPSENVLEELEAAIQAMYG